MNTWRDPYTRKSYQEEQLLYEHLLQLAQNESPSQLIEGFRCLFIQGEGYPDREIVRVLDQLAASKQAEQEFKFVLNRCCHILINRWQMHPQLQAAIPDLVGLFENPSPKMGSHSLRFRQIRRLQELLKLFIQSEQYITLRRLAQVINPSPDGTSDLRTKPLGTLIRRYSYLYEHCLLSEDSSYEQQQAIREMQSNVQQQFEVGLTQYLTYQFRQSHLAQRSSTTVGRQIIQPVKNPTLLSDRELFLTIKQFTGKVEKGHSYRDLAHSFITHSRQTRSFGSFKGELYTYLTSAIDPGYGKCQFNQRLSTHLQNILPQNDGQPVSELLLIRTCSNLLNFLVVDNPQHPHHFVFIDLAANLGISLTIGLLLKIVLICRKVKPYLEKRFSILFNHYESCTGDGVMWLIHALENLNIAFSIHFGAVDLSYLKQLKAGS